MYKFFPVFGLVAFGLMVGSMFGSPSSAHQKLLTNGNVGAMIHLDPNDSPYPGKPTKTWIMLMQRDGKMIAPASCNCSIAAYDARHQALAHHLPLTTIAVEGHQKGHQALATTITFPKPGAYTVVVTGQATDKSFAPFELKFPVTVRPLTREDKKVEEFHMIKLRYRSKQSLLAIPALLGAMWLLCTVHCALSH